jgi:anti-anti-sigma factor
LFRSWREAAVPERQAFSVSRAESSAVFYLKGELDMSSVPILQDALAEALVLGGFVIVDFADVTFMDSQGIRALIQSASTMVGGTLIVHGVRGPVQRVAELTGLDRIPGLHLVPCERDHGAQQLEGEIDR